MKKVQRNQGIYEVNVDSVSQEVRDRILRNTRKRRIQILCCVGFVLIMLLGIYLAIRYDTYGAMNVLESREMKNLTDSVCTQFGDGVVSCSGDGVAYWNQEGHELWNQACQIKKPIIQVRGDSVLVADRNGSDIYVFETKGLKGEIHTSRPIERVSVSEQGIVAAILRDDNMPLVVCYDATGNILVEHQTSFSNTGYPLDVALSPDGEMLIVSYLMVETEAMTTKVVFYDFGEYSESKTDYIVAQQEFSDTLIPSLSFLNKKQMVLAGEKALYFYEGVKEPELIQKVAIEGEIGNVVYGENRVAVLVESQESEVRLMVYDGRGNIVVDEKVEGAYETIRLYDERVILFEDKKCAIYSEDGVCKFQGEVSMNIKEIMPVAGLNKYMVISTSGFHKVQLVK